VAEKKLLTPAISKKFIPLGKMLSKLYPGLDVDLMQAEMSYEKGEYMGVVLLYAIIVFVVSLPVLLSLLYLTENLVSETAMFSLALSLAFSLVSYWYFSFYPKMVSLQKTREVERVLLYAMRHFLIKIKSGISIYESMVGIAQGPYGIISDEFQKTVKQINSGMIISEEPYGRLQTQSEPVQISHQCLSQLLKHLHGSRGRQSGDLVLN
jgi:flagellar protein FlaJ